MSMQFMEITIHPFNEGSVRAYVNIVFDNCLMPHGTIRLISC